MVKIKTKRKDCYPKYMSEGASGFDLRACIDDAVVIKPKSWEVIPTGIYVEVPAGYEIQVRPRSGLASKGITVLNTPGTVDSDYRGEIKIILANFSNDPFLVEPGMRIAQGVLCRIYKASFVEEPLSPTDRGSQGFGSTGT